MKKKILFIHSAGPQGTHEGSSDFVAYLRKQLADEYDVLYPIMPDPDQPEYKRWKVKVEKELANLGDKAILIGHSLGGSVLLKYLSEHTYKKSIAGLFLVAVPFWGKKDWEVNEFVLKDDFETKLPKIPKVFLYHSRRDEWVPFSHQNAYAQKLKKAKVRELDSDEHEFASGLPEQITDIKRLQINKGIDKKRGVKNINEKL